MFTMKVTSHIESNRPDKIFKALMKTIDFGAKKIEKRAKDLVPVDTGKLKKSIKIKKIKGGKSISPDTDYAAYVEFGTSGHGPKTARMMHWVNKKGEDVFARWVRGIRPQPYMRPALDENEKPIADHARKLIRKVLK